VYRAYVPPPRDDGLRSFLNVFDLLLRHALATGDGRPLGRGIASGMALATTDDVVTGLLTREQRAHAEQAPALNPAQQRAAEGARCASFGAQQEIEDARIARAAQHAAFDPAVNPQVIEFLPEVLAILREASNGQKVLCLANLSAATQLVPVPWRRVLGSANVRELIGGARLAVHGPSFELVPYDVRWLAA
jgi:NAD(P)-dependent dehydrogenase (short-subunit alcohol dehydrogenase family)